MAQPQPLHIRRGRTSIIVDPPVVAAPMAGVIDPPYRDLLHAMGCPLSFTEMISARGVVEDNPTTYMLIGTPPQQGLCGVQVFGADPECLGNAAERVSGLGFALLDINAGCPKRKVHVQGAGGALLKKPDLLNDLVRRVVSCTDLPVGVKMRSGWRNYDRRLLGEIVEGITSAGASYITIHARTVEQGFKGTMDADVVSHMRDRTDLPLIASGDVGSYDDALLRIDEGANGVMVGRALMGDPEWFLRYRRCMEGEGWTTYTDDPSLVDGHLDLALRHLDLQIGHYGEAKGVRDFRPHLSWYLKGLKHRAILHDRVFSSMNREDASSVIGSAREMWRSSR